MERFIKEKDVSLDLEFNAFNEWQDFLVLFRKLDDLDLVVLASGRHGTLSHHAYLDRMPARLEKYFPKVSKILVYP